MKTGGEDSESESESEEEEDGREASSWRVRLWVDCPCSSDGGGDDNGEAGSSSVSIKANTFTFSLFGPVGSPSVALRSHFWLPLLISSSTFSLFPFPARLVDRRLVWKMDRGVACPAETSLLLDEEEYCDVRDSAAGGAAVFLDDEGEVEEVEEDDCLEWRRWRELLPMTDGIAVFESRSQLVNRLASQVHRAMSRGEMRLAYRPVNADIDHRPGYWGSESCCLRNRALHNLKSTQWQLKPSTPSHQLNAIKPIDDR